MSNIDEMIREATDDKDQEILNQTKPLGYFALGLSQFRGNLGWVTWIIMVVQTTMFAASVWCAYKFFGAADPLTALKWGLPGAVLMLGGLVLKLSLMPQMQADRVLREVKRLELLVLARGH